MREAFLSLTRLKCIQGLKETSKDDLVKVNSLKHSPFNILSRVAVLCKDLDVFWYCQSYSNASAVHFFPTKKKTTKNHKQIATQFALENPRAFRKSNRFSKVKGH